MRQRIKPLGTEQGFLMIAEVSELLPFHPVTLREWARCGELPAIRIVGRWRLDPERYCSGVGTI
jgi:predicted site-specific integrase-resolvase